MSLNHYAINQVIQGRMVPGGRMRFGASGVLGVVGNMLKHRPRPNQKVKFDLASDRVIYDAFLKTWRKHSPEALLLDDELGDEFRRVAKKMGFPGTGADANRRLINIRKNPARYREHGLILPDAEVTEPQPSIVPKYAHIIEFSLARIHSQYGITIDDILIDPEADRQYQEMARAFAPELGPRQLRLAALYIRKTRYIKKKDATIIESLPTEQIEAKFTNLGTLDRVRAQDVAPAAGIVELLEDGRHLYISHTSDLHAAVQGVASESTLRFMGGPFWQPKPDHLLVRTFAGEEFLHIRLTQWQLRLIQDKKPVFNWPVAA